ncbi:MAG: family 43 glycosylhydrolase [Marinilabiliaceae bacterium]|nr:family 43 glycosylhydrolase [Marinilabiliaceae bacterium]
MRAESFILLLLFGLNISLAGKNENKSIISGVPWFDNNGKIVSAHGACIVKEKGLFYLFGEFKKDSSNTFNGFSCYSSKDLCNWKFENTVLQVQDSGRLGSNRVGERVKVMKCPSTGQFVMYMHTDDARYKDPCVGYATCDKINGDYIFKGPLLFNGKPIKKWDMGVFQDDDETGYLITHSGNLFRLNNDYKGVTKQVVKNMTGKCEAPAIFKKDGIYYWLGSDLTSWERNDNYYFTATSLNGPWESKGLFAPEGKLTWNSQSTYVLSICGTKDTTYMFMGDRWAFPRQNSSATYVWQPLEMSDGQMSLPTFIQSWKINAVTGESFVVELDGDIIEESNKKIKYKGTWENQLLNDNISDIRSNNKGASISYNFKGTRIGLYGVARPTNGYALVEIQNSKGEIILSNTIDMYCKYPESSLKYLSPVLKRGKYKLVVSVLGEKGNWADKKKNYFGSADSYVSFDKMLIVK